LIFYQAQKFGVPCTPNHSSGEISLPAHGFVPDGGERADEHLPRFQELGKNSGWNIASRWTSYLPANKINELEAPHGGANVTSVLNGGCRDFGAVCKLLILERETGLEPATSSLGKWAMFCFQ
jgi:hypothetical protein